MGKYNK